MVASGLPISGGSPPQRGAEPPDPLDPLETSAQPRDLTVDEEDECWQSPDATPFEHRGWAPMRRRVMASLIRTEQPHARRHDFWHCGERVHVFRSPTGEAIDFRPETCHDRFCLPCGQKRSRRIAEAVEGLMKTAASKLMFITLTIRGCPQDKLISLLDQLREGWKELRRLKGWKNTIKGGVIMLEVKYSRTSGGHWHPHYHLICEGAWLDEKWLSQAWSLITRGSDQVKVQRVKEERAALSYVSKYASKPVDPSFVNHPNLIDAAVRALKGVRLAACFGSWHGTPLSEGIENEEEETSVITEWVYEGTTDDLRIRAAGGDKAAEKLLAHVERCLRIRHALIDRCRGSPQVHTPIEQAT